MVIKPVVQVQPYAFVLVVDLPTQVITAASENCALFDWPPAEELIGTYLSDHFSEQTIVGIEKHCRQAEPGVVRLPRKQSKDASIWQLVVHQFAEEIVLEVEQGRNWPHPDDYATRLNVFTRELENAPTISTLLQRLCEGLRYHFGYDRIIMLQFDQQYNGLVTHESRKEDMPSFINIHFTSQDVTPATRYNQVVHPVHNLADVEEPTYPLVGSYGPAAREMLRRHVACREPNENFASFLRDIGLRCIGYLSLMVNDELYGSLYLHHREPMMLDYQMRSFLTVAGRVAQQKLSFHIYSRTLRLRQAANIVRDRLQDHIVNSNNLADGLIGGSTTLIDLIQDTKGAAICSDDALTLYGTTPSAEQVNDIIGWMKREYGDEELYHTDHFSILYPDARTFPDLAAGILFLPLDADANQWIVWFKPEVVQTVTYGSAASEESGDSERRFYVYDDTRHGYSLPWTTDDIGTAQALQVFIQEVVMQRYAQVTRSNELLRQAYEDLEVFSYTIGHDLRAPVRGIASFAEILQEDFGETIGEEGRGYLRHIQQNAERMREFMNDLLALSRLDRTAIIVNSLSVGELVDRVLQDRTTSEQHRYRCRVQEEMPAIRGDKNQLITVFTNLLSNAIKYSSQEAAPEITVGHTGEHRDGQPVFFVADNGIGIAPDQHGRIFDLFTRSTDVENFAGSGIGLALVRRILNFHEGEIWLESAVGEGTTFYFYTGV